MPPRFELKLGLALALVVAIAVFVAVLIAAFLFDLDSVAGRFGDGERSVLVIVVVSIAILLVAILLVAIAQRARTARMATLSGTALWVPWAAALTSSALYLGSETGSTWHNNAWAAGIAVALVLWVLYAVLDEEFPTARRQSPGWYGLLKTSIEELRRRATDGQAAPCLTLAQQEALRRRVTEALTSIEGDLDKPGLSWVTRAGFNTAWSAYHRAEEILLQTAPTESLIDVAASDILRLNGANIDSRRALQTGIRKAVADLDPDAELQIAALIAVEPKDPICPEPEVIKDAKVAARTEPQSVAKPPTTTTSAEPDWCDRLMEYLLMVTGRAPANAKPNNKHEGTPSTDRCVEQRRARSMIQAFHRALNTYRGTQWAELGRARWQLILTTTIAGTVMFLVLVLALVQRIAISLFVAGWAYFLVGAAAGLFLRLRLASEERQVSDDYGLEAARLYQTPLLSGMAAVIGVVLMASIAGSDLGQVLTPNTDIAVASVSASASPPSGASASAPTASYAAVQSATSAEKQTTEATLTAAFDLGTYPLGIVIALIFGLTPNLVLRRLGLSASEAKNELLNTRPA